MLRKLLLAATVAALTTGVAQATTVSGTAAFVDNGPAHDGLIFTGTVDNSALRDLNLNAGASQTLDNFLRITSHDTNDAFFGSATAKDNIATDFTFTLPSSGTGSVSGTGKETTDAFFGFIDGQSGDISWNNPGTVNFSDGAELLISLEDASFNPCAGPDQTIGVDATFKLLKDPTPVPEPGSLALLGTGLLGLCAVAHRRRAG